MKSDTDIYGIVNADCDKILPKMIETGMKFDLILTDPPYNVGKDFGSVNASPVL